MRLQKATGIILKRNNLGEADRILTVFTKTEGKVYLKAKGVRKITSKRASHIEPLNKITFSSYKKSAMPVLIEVVSLESFSSIKQDLTTVALAYHICELIDSLCPEGQENPEIFSLLEQMLFNLSNKKHIGNIIHEFEIRLLSSLGFLPAEHDLQGAKASFFIESILERKLKVRQILPLLI
jgi:DNA repair protein RecO (recombination protein O)